MSNPKRSERIARLEPVVRRIANARLTNPSDVDEVVQETLTRLLEAAERLELKTLASYAVVTARHLITSMERGEERAARLAPQLIDPSAPDDPQEIALRAEEHEAVIAALAQLDEDERHSLVDRDVFEVPTSEIAARSETTPGAASTRLARTRARARAEFLLAYRGLRPISEQCRPVLYAVAAGDRRRQEELDAGGHIASCPICGQLVEPLTRKSRGLAGILPFAGLSSAAGEASRTVRQHPAQSAAVVAVASGVLMYGLFSGTQPPSRSAAKRPVLTIDGAKALPLPIDIERRARPGAAAVARGAPVHSVPHDEGFWVGTSSTDRVWIVLRVSGESGPRVQEGTKVWFEGVVATHTPAWLRQLGLTESEGAGLLGRQGFHIEIKQSDLKIAST